MSYSQLILKDYADITWPLDDISASTSFSSPINFLDPSSTSFSASINLNNVEIQNIPMVYAGGNSLQFTSSAVGLSIPAMNRFSELYKDKNSVLTFWMKMNEPTPDEQPIFKKRGEENIGLFIQNNYFILKFGNSASFSQVALSVVELTEPHYVAVATGPGYLSLMVDGIEKRVFLPNNSLPLYSGNSNNDVIDFYGPREGFWEIDNPTFFPNNINFSTAKRHYVYGLGKWIDDNLFFSRGGNLYNFSTIETNKISDISWDYPEQWKLYEFNDLQADDSGIGPLTIEPPELYSFDGNIVTENNLIKFSSNSRTDISYIDFSDISQKIWDGSYPFFVKVKLNGLLPENQLSQRIVSYGQVPDLEMFNINLFNDDNDYKIQLEVPDSLETLSFSITNISASPYVYIGLGFGSNTTFYFAEENYSMQTASFSYLSASGFGLDPLVGFFPPEINTTVRVGATLIYDLKNFTPEQPYDFQQFYGTFDKFIVVKPEHISELSTFNDLELYKKMRYGAHYKSSENRFAVSSYGSGEFNLHPSDIAEIIDDDTLILGANVIYVGYPDIVSASNVVLTVTQYSYSGSVVNGPDRLTNLNHLGYLNNVNIADKYLRFEFEIYADDVFAYPPKLSYFHMETYQSREGKIILKDDAGPSYTIHPNTDSIVYLPESRLTPNVFLKNNSGIKLSGNVVDFTDNFFAVPLDPRDITGLVLWLDSRNPLGLRKNQYFDDQKINEWKDLSGNNFHAVQNSPQFQPVYRIQSLNLFTTDQLSGVSNNVLAVSASISSSTFNSFGGGIQSFEVKPNNTSLDSYLSIESSTASISIFPNQTYTVVGTITLNKRQTASALFGSARSIVVYNTDGVSQSISGTSAQATNARGSYSLSATFSTDSTTTGAIVRYYNGSITPDDTVYWSNIGLYPVSSSVSFGSGGSASTIMPISEWAFPLTEPNDHPVIKFDGEQTFMETAASVSQPYTMFIVGRAFNDGVFVGYTASGASLYSYDGNYYISSGSAQVQAPSSNDYNIYTIQVDSGSARFFLNGSPWSIKETGLDNINGLLIGKGTLPDNSENYLSGDISSVVLYSGKLTYQERSAVENWLDESYNLLAPVIGLTKLNDQYLNEYTQGYPIS